MDIQLTDHENAAYSNFIVLLSHTISHFDLNFYIPLSRVDENMESCQRRNAVINDVFWFRKEVSPLGTTNNINVEDEYEEMTVADIMDGTDEKPGICTWIDRYLDSQPISECTRDILKAHVNLIRERAIGTRMTNATWIRNFVLNHPLYKHDSVVGHEINFDLMEKITKLDPEEMLYRV